jgi:hypothetical protein
MQPRRAESMARAALQVLWPAFMMAGVLEIGVFALVDPSELHWPGGAVVELSRQAVYSLAFLVFWAVTAMASAITALLMQDVDINSKRA